MADRIRSWQQALAGTMLLVPWVASCDVTTVIEDAAAAAVRGQILAADGAGVPAVQVHLQAIRFRDSGFEDVVAGTQATTAADGTFAAGMGAIGLSAGEAELRLAVLAPDTQDTLAVAIDVVHFTRDGVCG